MEVKYNNFIVNNDKLVVLLKKQRYSLVKLGLYQIRKDLIITKKIWGKTLNLSNKSIVEISKILKKDNGLLLSKTNFLESFKELNVGKQLGDIFNLYSNKEGYSPVLSLIIGLSFFSSKVKIKDLLHLFGDEIDPDDLIYLLEMYFKMIYFSLPILSTIEENPKKIVLSVNETYLNYSKGKISLEKIVSWIDYYRWIYGVSYLKE